MGDFDVVRVKSEGHWGDLPVMNAPSPTGEVFEMVNCGGVVSRAPSMKHVEEIGNYFALND